MKWIRHSNDGVKFGGRLCMGNPAYVSEDGTLVITQANFVFEKKTPWLLSELRDGNTYCLDRTIMENRGYATMKEAKAAAEEYIKRKSEVM
jgi:hypothetical protein